MLQSLYNYLVPVAGNTTGFIVYNPNDGDAFDPSKLSSETGQLFVPSGLIVYNDGATTGRIDIFPTNLSIAFPASNIRYIPFPAVDGQKFTMSGFTGAKICFVDFPVIPADFANILP